MQQWQAVPAAAPLVAAAGAADDPLVSLLHALPCGCLLLRDSLTASGHFLLPWITAASLNQGHKVVFVAAAYSPAKHRAALKKIGAPVGGSAAGALAGYNSSSSSPIVFVTPAAQQQQQQQQQQDQQPAEGSSSPPRLQQLYQQVEAAARQVLGQDQQQQQHLTVVVDSLTCLSSLVCDDQQAAALLHQLAALGEVLQVPCRLVLLAAKDVAADKQLLAAAAARSHIVADLSPLEGRTAALDGCLTVGVRQACKRPLVVRQNQQEQQLLVGAAVPSCLCPGSCSVWFFRAGDVGIRWLSELHGKELMASH